MGTVPGWKSWFSPEAEDELQPSLMMLKDTAKGIDAALSDAAAQKTNAIAVRNSARDARMKNHARARLGNVFTEAALEHEPLVGGHCRQPTQNRYGDGVWKRNLDVWNISEGTGTALIRTRAGNDD